MKKVIDVKREDVFMLLAKGNEVYGIYPEMDSLSNLKFESVEKILKYIQDECYAFFIVVESED